MGVIAKIINNPIPKDNKAGVKIDNKLEIPDSFIELSSLFFKNFTKKNIPVNKKIKMELSIKVFIVFKAVKIIKLNKKLSICLSLKKINSSTKFVNNEIDKKTSNTIKKHLVNS